MEDGSYVICLLIECPRRRRRSSWSSLQSEKWGFIKENTSLNHTGYSKFTLEIEIRLLRGLSAALYGRLRSYDIIFKWHCMLRECMRGLAETRRSIRSTYKICVPNLDLESIITNIFVQKLHRVHILKTFIACINPTSLHSPARSHKDEVHATYS